MIMCVSCNRLAHECIFIFPTGEGICTICLRSHEHEQQRAHEIIGALHSGSMFARNAAHQAARLGTFVGSAAAGTIGATSGFALNLMGASTHVFGQQDLDTTRV